MNGNSFAAHTKLGLSRAGTGQRWHNHRTFFITVAMVTSRNVLNFLVYCTSRNTCEWSQSGCQNRADLWVMLVAQCPCNKGGGDTNKKRLPLSICSSPRADRVSGFSLVQCIVCAFMKPRLFWLSVPCQDQIKRFLWSLAHLRNVMKWGSYLLSSDSGENVSFSEVIQQKGKDELFSWKKIICAQSY